MTLTSMNPRGSAHSECVLSEHTLKILQPLLRSLAMWHRERTRLAVHEAGHVVVGNVLGLPVPNAAAITGFGGFVTAADVGLHTLDTALDQITTLLAGHAAESTFLGRPSNGSGLGINSDLSRATALAANVLFHWGLDNRLTHILSEPTLQLGSGDHDGGRIEATLQKQRTRAVQIIEDHREVVERLANALRAHRELGKDDIRALLNPKDNHQTDCSLMMEVRHDA